MPDESEDADLADRIPDAIQDALAHLAGAEAGYGEAIEHEKRQPEEG